MYCIQHLVRCDVPQLCLMDCNSHELDAYIYIYMYIYDPYNIYHIPNSWLLKNQLSQQTATYPTPRCTQVSDIHHLLQPLTTRRAPQLQLGS